MEFNLTGTLVPGEHALARELKELYKVLGCFVGRELEVLSRRPRWSVAGRICG